MLLAIWMQNVWLNSLLLYNAVFLPAVIILPLLINIA